MRYTFGDITLDTGTRTIASGAVPVHLTRKAFDLLVLFLESRPDAVSKEQIFSRLWPDTFVTEASLQTLVHEIRQAIDEQGRRDSWIRTVHGIGYRFAGEVVCERATATSSPQASAWLVGESRRVALRSGENIVGRDVDDVIEIDHPTISRRHARIVIAEHATLEDLGSKNGTWLNDLRVTQVQTMSDGDVVSLGTLKFTFQLVRRPKSTASAELPT
jgi:DNA-binding winged helix-turn-helix (wHTH) protein